MRSDSEDERAFIALNISMTTRMESDIVEPLRVVIAEGAKIEQSVVANCGDDLEQLWKCDCRKFILAFSVKVIRRFDLPVDKM